LLVIRFPSTRASVRRTTHVPLRDSKLYDPPFKIISLHVRKTTQRHWTNPLGIEPIIGDGERGSETTKPKSHFLTFVRTYTKNLVSKIWRANIFTGHIFGHIRWKWRFCKILASGVILDKYFDIYSVLLDISLAIFGGNGDFGTFWRKAWLWTNVLTYTVFLDIFIDIWT
jgi:hypothetical protein